MPTLRARGTTFDAIQPGDNLPILIKEESPFSFNLCRSLLTPEGETPRLVKPPTGPDDKDTPREDNGGMPVAAYMAELLEKVFGTRALTRPGGRLQVESKLPFRIGDVASFSGQVAAKRDEGGKHLVDLELNASNYQGKTIASGRATVVMA